MTIIAKFIQARFKGRCFVCRGMFAAGDAIAYYPNGPRKDRARHASCTPTPEQEEKYGTPPTPKPTPEPTPEPAPEPTPASGITQALRAALRVEEIVRTEVGRIKIPDVQDLHAKVAELQDKVNNLGQVVTTRIETPIATIEAAPGEIQHPEYLRLARWIASGVTRIWITGEAGTGKTHAVEQITRALGYPLHILGLSQTKYDVIGYQDGSGRYQPTPVHRWAADPNDHSILLLDEADGHAPDAALALNACLANGIGVFPHEQVAVNIQKIVIATANTTGEGPSMRYSARSAQDGSLLDRFSAWLHWGLHEPTERRIALQRYPYDTTHDAVTASHQIRSNLANLKIDSLAWGPRRTYAVCALYAAGESLRSACLFAGVSRLEQGQQDPVLEGVAS